MLTKRGPDLAVAAGTGRGKHAHGPVESAVELRAVRGEAERVGRHQLVLRAGQQRKQACDGPGGPGREAGQRGRALGPGGEALGPGGEAPTKWL